MQESNSKEESQKQDEPMPSDGERAFAWVFCLFYLSVMAGVIFVVVMLVMAYLFKDLPKGIGFLLPFIVFGLLPHATKAVAVVLARTRGLSPISRLGKILAEIHS
jgi:hypothetical protein